MHEKIVSASIKKFMKENNVIVTSIENITAGVPDIHCTDEEQEFWIEAKVIRANKIILRPSQCAWIYAHSKKINNVFIVASIDTDVHPTLKQTVVIYGTDVLDFVGKNIDLGKVAFKHEKRSEALKFILNHIRQAI